MNSSAIELQGYDPLSYSGAVEQQEAYIAQSQKRVIQNILKSYTGYFDVFSELIQNSLDATEKKWKDQSDKYTPRIWLKIDMASGVIRVTDNGIGMTLPEFKFFLSPNISFKSNRESRGNKGVGATFLAYGFSVLRAQTKRGPNQFCVALRQGRQWADSTGDQIPRPRFEIQDPFAGELASEETGTSIEIVLGSEPGSRPRDLGWIGATTAEQWCNALRIKTPLGAVYFKPTTFKPVVKIEVIAPDGKVTDFSGIKPEYFFPHEVEIFKVASITDIELELNKITGSPENKFQKLDGSLKRLDCIYEIFSKEEILRRDSPFESAIKSDTERSLIEKHDVSVYLSFLGSAKYWARVNDEVLGLRSGQRLIRGGLQMASDNMVQGDLSVIPLTSTIGYQANSHVIVHFVDGNPDMGRKVFQPEITLLAETLAVRAVTIAKRYLQHLKPDTGSRGITPDKALHDWRKSQELHRDQRPLVTKIAGHEISIVSELQQEQDVIALFHQMIGAGILKGYKFYATSQSEIYDSLFYLDYKESDNITFNRKSCPLGISPSYSPPFVSQPKILEYKYDLDALIRDFEKEIKFAKHIDLVVCWQAESQFKERYFLISLLTADNGSSREHFGATHEAFPEGGGNQPDFEVIILSDLLRYLSDPIAEEARQKQVYKD